MVIRMILDLNGPGEEVEVVVVEVFKRIWTINFRWKFKKERTRRARPRE